MIYCNVKCPICEQSLRVMQKRIWYRCENKCYYLYRGKDRDRIRIFDDVFSIKHNFEKPERRNVKALILKQINYWKENDRYLIRILERND